MSSIDERSLEIGANFLAWTIDTGPCPISINDVVWFKRLCGLFETQANLEAELARLREAADETCQWEYVDDEQGLWRPSCMPDELWQYTFGGPTDNGAKFCVYCGRKLVIAPQSPEAS